MHDHRVIHATAPGIGPEADGLFTTDPEIAVAVSTADCFPVALLADSAAGMAHAGWRGVAADVVPETAQAMAEAGHPPRVAVIGPGIGPCCFEVGPEVLEVFPQDRSETTWGTPSVDLARAISRSLPEVDQVIEIGACTHHDDRFHSFRRDGTEQRQFGVAWIAHG